jgi:hypothetical protein
MTHTPLPWYSDGNRIYQEISADVRGDKVAECPSSRRAIDDAELIVRSVNAHQELLEVLSLAVRYLEHPDVQAISFARPAASIAELIRSAIAKATEGEQS